MHVHRLALLAALTLAAPAWAGPGDGHDHRPLHGGIVAQVKDVDYELVARKDALMLYVRDHGKPVDLRNTSATITLLTGSERRNVALQRIGDRLEAPGPFDIKPGTKAVLQITRDGKVGTARFAVP